MEKFKKGDIVRLRNRGVVTKVRDGRMTVEWDKRDNIGIECLEIVKKPRDMFWTIIVISLASLAAVARVVFFAITGS